MFKGQSMMTGNQNASFHTSSKDAALFCNAWRIFFGILAIVFVVEAGVMFLLPLLLPDDVNEVLEAIVDASLLTLGTAPLLWLAFIRPLQQAGLEKLAIIAAVAESAAEGLIIFDAEGKSHSVNNSASSIYGMKLEDLRTSNALKILPEEIAHLCTGDVHSPAKSAGRGVTDSRVLKQSMETAIRREDGRSLAVQISLSATLVREKPIYLAVVQDIDERKRHECELADLHQQLLDTSRRAGMSEIATGILHNVGNVLNSINVSVNLLKEMTRLGHAGDLQQAVEMLDQNRDRLAEFLSQDGKGAQLLQYLKSLSKTLQQEKKDFHGELDALIERVEHIKEVVSMQQTFARVSGVKEKFLLSDAIEDAIKINNAGLQRHGVNISCDICTQAEIVAERHKVIQILINLISNAKYAVSATDNPDKQVSICVDKQEDKLLVTVQDNGIGISQDHLARIFAHGFTTKKDGHGFGLHSSALAAKELAGTLVAESQGLGHGAAFTLSLPVSTSIPEDELCLT